MRKPEATAVPKPPLDDDERGQLPDLPRLVKELEVGRASMSQAVDVTLGYSILGGQPAARVPETYVLSLPAAAKLARQLQEAVDVCLYGPDLENLD